MSDEAIVDMVLMEEITVGGDRVQDHGPKGCVPVRPFRINQSHE